MNIQVLLTLVLCYVLNASNVLAAKSSAVAKIRTKQKKSVIDVTNGNFEKLLDGPRDYYIAVVLTATSSQVGCTLCRGFDPDYSTVANSWVQDHPENDGLFFAKADFNDNRRKVFDRYQIQQVPKLYLYRPTNDSTKLETGFIEYPFREGDNMQGLIDFIEQETGKKIDLKVPVNYEQLALTVVTLLITLAVTIKFRGTVLEISKSKILWSLASVVAILLLISGYMFNTIRGSPYMGYSGPYDFFLEGQQNQYGIETNFVSSVYGVMAILCVVLITKIPSINNTKVRMIGVLVVSFALFVSYSVLFDIFSKKSPGYPFHFLRLI